MDHPINCLQKKFDSPRFLGGRYYHPPTRDHRLLEIAPFVTQRLHHIRLASPPILSQWCRGDCQHLSRVFSTPSHRAPSYRRSSRWCPSVASATSEQL